MAASRDEISEWFDEGAKIPENTHMLVVCDEFDWEDYPIYISADDDARTKRNEYDEKPMSKVMECYNLKKAKRPQMDVARCWEF